MCLRRTRNECVMHLAFWSFGAVDDNQPFSAELCSTFVSNPMMWSLDDARRGIYLNFETTTERRHQIQHTRDTNATIFYRWAERALLRPQNSAATMMIMIIIALAYEWKLLNHCKQQSFPLPNIYIWIHIFAPHRTHECGSPQYDATLYTAFLFT